MSFFRTLIDKNFPATVSYNFNHIGQLFFMRTFTNKFIITMLSFVCSLYMLILESENLEQKPTQVI